MCVFTKKSKLHVSCWNINGYRIKGFNKYQDPRFLKEIETSDIICLMETHCTQEESLNLKGFSSFNLTRKKSKRCNKVSGGISVFIKSDIKPGVKFLEHKTNDYIWLQLCKDFMGTQEDIYLCFVYNPPSNSSYTQSLDEEIFEIIEKDIDKYSKKGKIILSGDLNSRTGSEQLDFISEDNNSEFVEIFDNYSPDVCIPIRYSNDKIVSSRGKFLNDLCIQTSMRILNGRTTGDHTGKFTCYTPNGCSVVDYFIVSEKLLDSICFFKVHDLVEDLSDHCKTSILLNVNCNLKFDVHNMKTFPTGYIWNDDSLASFQNLLSSVAIQQTIQNFNVNDFSNDSNKMVTGLNNIFYEVANLSLKQKCGEKAKWNTRKKGINKKPKWLNAPLSKMKRQLSDRTKLLEKYPLDPHVRSSFFSLLKQYRKVRKKSIREFHSNFINQLDTLREQNPSQYWSLLSDLSNTNKQGPNPDVLEDKWFSYFKSLNDKTNHPINMSNVHVQTDLDDMEKVKIFTELDNLISKNEIEKAIYTLKNKKSSGFDFILNEMIKASTSYLTPCFQKVFNCILSTGVFPNIWAKGYIVPIFKGGIKDDPSNYRGITIGSCLGKLFVKILNFRLEKFLIDRNIINPEQIGFCKGKRTADHQFVLRTIIEKYTQQGTKKLYTCFVDLKRAFDTVNHDGLFYKMRKIGISDLFYKTIKSMYNNTELCVKVDKKHMTENFSSNIGVRQGDNLSPTLFKIFINDLVNCFDGTCKPVVLNSINLNCLLYADDLVLISETPDGLQCCLDKLQIYCEEWGLQINTRKTKSVVFNNTGKIDNNIFSINNIPIDRAKGYKYLGVYFSASGSFTETKKDLYDRGLKAFFKFKKCFELYKPNIETLTHLFDHTVKPVLLYGSEIWGAFDANKFKSDKHLHNLCKDLRQELVHIKFCKYSLGVGKKATNIAVLGELGRYPLYLEVLFNLLKYYKYILTSGDLFLSEALAVSKSLHSGNKKCWYSCVEHLLKYLDTEMKTLMKNKKLSKSLIYKKLLLKYNIIWNSELFNNRNGKISGNKLRTYRTFKNNISLEKYLSVLKEDQRILFTKFRISAHKLEIEKGRYSGLRVEERLCKLCNLETEDETHFLLQCPILEQGRSEIIHNICCMNINFIKLSPVSKLIWLMSSEDNKILKMVGTLLSKLHKERNQWLSDHG